MTQEPPEGGWAIHNIITHLRDAQGVLDYREEFGVVSIKQQVSYFASHELTHLPQIEQL